MTRAKRVVVFGGSAGCMPVIIHALRGLRSSSSTAIFVAYHRAGPPFDWSPYLRDSGIRSQECVDAGLVEADVLYHANGNGHMLVREGRLETPPDGPPPRPNIDLLLESVANEYGSRASVLLLSGSGTDGVRGCQVVRARGGLVLAQAPESAAFPRLPAKAIAAGAVDAALPVREIVARASRLVAMDQ